MCQEAPRSARTLSRSPAQTSCRKNTRAPDREAIASSAFLLAVGLPVLRQFHCSTPHMFQVATVRVRRGAADRAGPDSWADATAVTRPSSAAATATGPRHREPPEPAADAELVRNIRTSCPIN